MRAATTAVASIGSFPWPIDQALPLDMRRRVYETGHTEMLTRDKKNVIAMTFVVWRIADPILVRAAFRLASVESQMANWTGLPDERSHPATLGWP